MAANYFSQYTSPNIVVVPVPCVRQETEKNCESFNDNYQCADRNMNKLTIINRAEKHVNPNLTYVQISSTITDTPTTQVFQQTCITETSNQISVQCSQESFEETQPVHLEERKKYCDMSEIEIDENTGNETESIEELKIFDTQLNDTKRGNRQKYEEKHVDMTLMDQNADTKTDNIDDDKVKSLLLQKADKGDKNDRVDDIVKNIIKNSSLKKKTTDNKKELNIELTINIKTPYKSIVDNENNAKTTKSDTLSVESDVAFLEDLNIDEIVDSLRWSATQNLNFDSDVSTQKRKKENLPKAISTENNSSEDMQNVKHKTITHTDTLSKGTVNCNSNSSNIKKNSNSKIKKSASSNPPKAKSEIHLSDDLTQERDFSYLTNKIHSNRFRNNENYGFRKNTEIKTPKSCNTKVKVAFNKNKTKNASNKRLNGNSGIDRKYIKDTIEYKTQKTEFQNEPFAVTTSSEKYINEKETLKRQNVESLKNKVVYKIPKIKVLTDSNEKKLLNNTTDKTIQTTVETQSKPERYHDSSPINVHNAIKKTILIEPLSQNPSKRNIPVSDPKCRVFKAKEINKKTVSSKNKKNKLKAVANSKEINKQKKRSANLRLSIRKYIEANYSTTFYKYRRPQKPRPHFVSIKNTDATLINKNAENIKSKKFVLNNSQIAVDNNILMNETEDIMVNQKEEDGSKTPEHIKKIIEYLESVEGNKNIKDAKNSVKTKNKTEPSLENKSYEVNDLVTPKLENDRILSPSKILFKVDKLSTECVHLNLVKEKKASKIVCNRENEIVHSKIKKPASRDKICNHSKSSPLKRIDNTDKIVKRSEKKNLNTMLEPTKEPNPTNSENCKFDSAFKGSNLRLNDISNKTIDLSKNKKCKDYSTRKFILKVKDSEIDKSISKVSIVESNLNVEINNITNWEKHTMSAKGQIRDKAFSGIGPNSFNASIAKVDNDNKITALSKDIVPKPNKNFKKLENKESITVEIPAVAINNNSPERCVDDNITIGDKPLKEISENSKNQTPNHNTKTTNETHENTRGKKNTINKNYFKKVEQSKDCHKMPKLSNTVFNAFCVHDKNSLVQCKKANSSTGNSNNKTETIMSQHSEMKNTSFAKQPITLNIDSIVKSEFQDKNVTFGEHPNYDIIQKIPHIQELSQIFKLRDALFTMLDDSMFLYFKKRLYASYSLICEGTYSSILKCKNDLEEVVAVKILRKGYLPKVYKILKEIQNTIPETNFHCIALVHDFKTEHYWSVMMEYYPKNLHEALHKNKRSFCIDVVQDLFRQLVTASFTLKCNGIIHSDIHPKHILLNHEHNKLKLCGFDQSNTESFYSDSKNFVPTIGTVQYRSPEIILGIVKGKNSRHSIDVWSIACVIYEMVTNRKLFHGETNNDILFEQISLIGNLSQETINEAAHREKYFSNGKFLYKSLADKDISAEPNTRSTKIFKSIMGAYFQQWADERTAAQIFSDRCKLSHMNNLITKMLVMEPKNRITIEFVMANPFIYK